MLLHTVTLDLSGLDPSDVDRLDEAMSSLHRISSVRWAAVGRSQSDDRARIIAVAVDDEAGLAEYRRDPVHLEVAAQLRGAGLRGVKSDWWFDEADLPIS